MAGNIKGITIELNGDTTKLDKALRNVNMRGLRMSDTETMTLGMWVDYVIEWNNIHFTEKEPAKKRATQADFDAF